MHPLVIRILAVRNLIAELEKSPGRFGSARRQEIMRQSLFLDGLEEAAKLALDEERARDLYNDEDPPSRPATYNGLPTGC